MTRDQISINEYCPLVYNTQSKYMAIPVRYKQSSEHYEGFHSPFWIELNELKRDNGEHFQVATRNTWADGSYSL